MGCGLLLFAVCCLLIAVVVDVGVVVTCASPLIESKQKTANGAMAAGCCCYLSLIVLCVLCFLWFLMLRWGDACVL